MPVLTDDDRRKIVDHYQEGMDMRSIAEAFGVSFSTISITLKKMGVKARRAGRPKSEQPGDVRVRELYIHGWSLRSVAAELGISYMAVSTSLNRTQTPKRRSSKK